MRDGVALNAHRQQQSLVQSLFSLPEIPERNEPINRFTGYLALEIVKGDIVAIHLKAVFPETKPGFVNAGRVMDRTRVMRDLKTQRVITSNVYRGSVAR